MISGRKIRPNGAPWSNPAGFGTVLFSGPTITSSITISPAFHSTTSLNCTVFSLLSSPNGESGREVTRACSSSILFKIKRLTRTGLCPNGGGHGTPGFGLVLELDLVLVLVLVLVQDQDQVQDQVGTGRHPSYPGIRTAKGTNLTGRPDDKTCVPVYRWIEAVRLGSQELRPPAPNAC